MVNATGLAVSLLVVGLVVGAGITFEVVPSQTKTTTIIETTTPVPTYTINGLTCPIPSDYLSFHAVVQLLPVVTMNTQFLGLANGSRYVFGNAGNITNRVQLIGNQTVHLPDVVEMVFYGYGPVWSQCTRQGPWQSTIVVQVPVQNNAFNLTGATYHLAPGGPS